MKNYLVIHGSSGIAEAVELIEEGDLLIGNISFLSSLLLEKLKSGNTVDEAVSHLLVNFLNSNVLKPITRQLIDITVSSEISLPHLDLPEEQTSLLAKKINAESIGPNRLVYNAFLSVDMKLNWQLALYSDKNFLRIRSFGKKSLLQVYDYCRDLFGDDFEELFVKIKTHFMDILDRKCSEIVELAYMDSYQKIVPFLSDPKNVRLKDIALGRYFLQGPDIDDNALPLSFYIEQNRLWVDFQKDCDLLLTNTLTKH